MGQGGTHQPAVVCGIFSYCGVQDQSIGKVMLQQSFGIIILYHTDCEVKTGCCLKCTGEKKKHMETRS